MRVSWVYSEEKFFTVKNIYYQLTIFYSAKIIVKSVVYLLLIFIFASIILISKQQFFCCLVINPLKQYVHKFIYKRLFVQIMQSLMNIKDLRYKKKNN